MDAVNAVPQRTPVASLMRRPGWALGLLALAGVGTVLAMLLTGLDAGGEAALWENLHWTLAAVVAVGIALHGARRAVNRDARETRTWIAAAVVIYLVGMIAWDLQWVLNLLTVPALSDVFFLGMAVPVLLGIRRWLSGRLDRGERVAVGLDGATVFLAVVTAIVAMFGDIVSGEQALTGAIALAYPMAFLAAGGTALVAAVAAREQLRPRGIYLVLAGFLMMGLAWAEWIAHAVDAIPPPGFPVNYLFSIAIVVIAAGGATWANSVPATARARHRLSRLSIFLPVSAVVIAVAVLIAEAGSSPDGPLVESLAAGTVFMAMARQSVLVAQRTQLMELERNLVERERLAGTRATTALESQLASERHYRSVLEGFNRLGQQISFVREESELLDSVQAALEQLLPGVEGDIQLLNESRDRLTVAAAWGGAEGSAGEILPSFLVDRCPALRRGTPYLLADATNRTYLRCGCHPIAEGSLLCVPLIALGETIGVVHLRRERSHAFDPDAQEIANRVSEHLALALANRRLLAKLETQALTDGLTGLHNARFFDPFLDEQLALARRRGIPIGVIALDIDHFKRFNDTHGHAAGDEALRDFAKAMVRCLREADVIARYGGEEFAVALVGCDLDGTRHVAEKLRQAAEGLTVNLGRGQTGRLTVSCGVASTDAAPGSRMELMRLADEALYQAKEAGRNRVHTADVLASAT